MKKLIYLFVMVMLVSGCATIMHPKTTEVSINSDPYLRQTVSKINGVLSDAIGGGYECNPKLIEVLRHTPETKINNEGWLIKCRGNQKLYECEKDNSSGKVSCKPYSK